MSCQYCSCLDCLSEFKKQEEFSDAVAKRKAEIDPSAWVSYSGKPKSFKQSMERRRIASTQQAIKQIQEEAND